VVGLLTGKTGNLLFRVAPWFGRSPSTRVSGGLVPASTARIILSATLVVIGWLPLDVAAQVSIPRERLPAATRQAILRGTVVKQSPTAQDTVAAQANAVVLQRNEVLIARTREPYLDRVVPRADTGAGGQVVQDSVYNLGVELTSLLPGTQQVVTYKAQFIPHGGAYYSTASARYEGHFSVAVVDANGANYSLATPLTLTFGGEPETYEPPDVSVTRAGDKPSRVKLLSRTARDSVAIMIFMGSDTDGVPFRIPVQATLRISGPARMEGFGVDVAKYQVSVDGPGGPGLQVGVITDRGSLDRDEIQLGPSGTGSIGLKSGDGLGSAILTARAPNMAQGTLPVEFVFPVLFLVFMLAGGTTGALFAESQSKKRRGTRSAVPRVVGAVLGAVLATVVYVGLGINLLLPILVTAPLGSELAVFAFAALGGWLGLRTGAGGEAPAPKTARRAA
jgi:hypothetical protein